MGVIHKATQGLKYVDTKYAEQEKPLKKKDISGMRIILEWEKTEKAKLSIFLESVGDKSQVLLALDIVENRNDNTRTSGRFCC